MKTDELWAEYERLRDIHRQTTEALDDARLYHRRTVFAERAAWASSHAAMRRWRAAKDAEEQTGD